MAQGFPNRAALEAEQLARLRALLAAVLPANRFYAAKLAGLDPAVASLEDFCARVPLTTKAEIVADQRAHPPYGTNLTYPVERYTRCHHTSGTSGQSIRWLDTAESWEWLLDNWAEVYRAAGIGVADRIFYAFSFGPFIGFWTAFESAARLGALRLAGGGMSSSARLRAIFEQDVTVLCCTPTYALHLAEVAAREPLDLRRSPVRHLIVAGEPGGSLPAVRQRLEQAWPGARIHDHHGMTEVGPVTYECPVTPGRLHVIERSYLAEVLEGQTLRPVPAGTTGELVLTPLGRHGSPLLRYRTGDVVRPLRFERAPCACGSFELALDGGILGRTDDMLIVRGVNVYPSAFEEILRGAGGVAEYRVRVREQAALTELLVEVEPEATVADPVAFAAGLERRFLDALSLRVPVRAVAPGALPRFEMKARRWVRD
jgi:phenylacetate-CoA ligase